MFPEGENHSILRAAAILKREGLINPILVGSSKKIQDVMCEQKILERDLCIVDPMEDEALTQYIISYCEERQMPEAVGRRILSQPLFFSAMMVKKGRAHCIVAGIDHPTEEVIMASELILGIKEGICVPSSFYLVEIPGFKGSQENLMIFSDPSMNPDPNAKELADIAYTTAQSVRTILGWEPKVAFLSFSTKGSADHPLVNKIQTACECLEKKNCDFLFDGELQADAAINP
ncbi:MAG: phosphate acyltransferase, partial [Bacillota bacterium]